MSTSRRALRMISMLTLCVFLLASPLAAQGAPWSGILDPSRAIDWSQAGVSGGIPTRTTICATLNPGATAAQINTAIQNCPSGQVVYLNAGTYNLSDDGIVMKSNVTLRGAGADQTHLVFATANPCAGGWATVCFGGGDSSDWSGDSKEQPGGSNAADWTAGFDKGSTQITLANIGSSGVSVGQYIYLDQNNDTSTTNGLFNCETTSANPPCSVEGGAGDPGRIINNIARQQVQMVKVTAKNGNTYTITPGLYAPNWSAGKSPGAWWPSETIQYAGLEDVTVDATNSGGLANVSLYNAMNVWVTGTRQLRTCTCQRNMIWMGPAAHATVQNNYFYGTTGHSQNYGVESFISSDNLVVNNIFHHVVSPMMVHSNTGSVYAYNYAINDTYDDGRLPQYHWLAGAIGLHSGGVMYNLFEGNIGPGFGGDYIHGNQVMNTVFRNYWLGSDPNRIDNLFALSAASWNRYWNVIGNVLGTPGLTTSYSGSNPGIYDLGYGYDPVPDDPLVATTMMRWGNYDTVNGSVRWLASEVPSGLSQYANAVPSSQTLPASFYLSSQPSWWPASKPWPAIGPDVTGGNISGLAGHVYTIPTKECYANIMGGPADGTGNPLNFNANTCYGSGSRDTSLPSSPRNIRIR